jgi:protein-L-isoaspartate(D-aspartate) O-methyltransferase
MAEAVIAIEDSEARVEEAQTVLAEQNVDNVVMQAGPLSEGAAEHGPYDVILVQGGVEELPNSLLDQLKDGGRIACVRMTGALGDVQIGHKLDGDVNWRSVFNAGAPVLKDFVRARAFAL